MALYKLYYLLTYRWCTFVRSKAISKTGKIDNYYSCDCVISTFKDTFKSTMMVFLLYIILSAFFVCKTLLKLSANVDMWSVDVPDWGLTLMMQSV